MLNSVLHCIFWQFLYFIVHFQQTLQFKNRENSLINIYMILFYFPNHSYQLFQFKIYYNSLIIFVEPSSKSFQNYYIFMISNIKKNIAQVSFRERITTSSVPHIDFYIALFLEIMAFTNLLTVVQRNNLTKFDSIILFLFHVYRLDVLQKIFSATIVIVFSFLLFFYFLLIRNHTSYFGKFTKIIPFGCAVVLIQIETHIFQNTKNLSTIPLEFFIIFFFIVLVWIIKLIAFPQNYMIHQSKLTKFPVILRTFMFIIQILILILKMNIYIFLIFTLVIEIVHILYSLIKFQYLCKDLEFLYFLSKYLTITVNLFYLLQITSLIPKHWFIELIPYILFIFLQCLDLLKTIFSKKYNRILKINNLTASQVIIIYNLILKENLISTKICSIFKFTPSNFQQKILIKRLLCNENKLDKFKEPEQKSFIKRETVQFQKRQSISNLIHFQAKQKYLLSWLEKQQLLLHSEFLTIYLCFSYLSQKNYLKSIQYLMKACKIKNYGGKMENLSSIYQLFYFELEHYKSISHSLNIISEHQQSYIKSCFINHRSKISIDLNHLKCISLQLQLEELLKKIQKLISTTNSLITDLNIHSFSPLDIESSKIKDILLQKIQQKHEIQFMIQKKCSQGYYSKKFIFLYYIYLNVCCSQSYTVFEKLKPLLDVTNGNDDKYLEKKSSENDMMVMVSIQDENVGVIQYANVQMKTFFSLEQHKIKSKTERIQKLIPKSIAPYHNDLMMQFKTNGRSKFIGKRTKLITIQNQQKPYQIYIDMKIFVALNGNISLTSRIILIKEQANIILFNSIGKILENTLDLKMARRKSKLGNLNIFRLIGMDIQPNLRKIKPQVFTARFENKLAKIMIESLEFNGDYLGICKIKFLNKDTMTIRSTLKKSTYKIINSLKSISDKQTDNCLSQERKNFELEFRIQNMKITHQLKCQFLIFLLISLFILVCSFSYIQYQLTSTSSIASFYIDILNGFRTRFFLMNNRFLLLHAINNNIISDNIAATYNISSLSKYVKDTTLSYLSTFDALDSMIIKYSLTIPAMYINKFANQIITYLIPYKFQTSWVSMLSLMKSFYYQNLFANTKTFEAMWNDSTLPFNNYLNNDFFSQNNNKIYIDTINNSVTSAEINGKNIDGLIYFMGIILLLLIAVILLTLNRIHNKIYESISLLVDIHSSQWKIKLKKIKLVEESLQVLSQQMIINYKIEYEFQSIKYYLEGGDQLTMEHGEIYLQTINQNRQNVEEDYIYDNQINTQSGINKKISTFHIQKSDFLKTHIHYILIILLFSLPLFGVLLKCLTISTSNQNATTFFYSYMNSIANFRISQSIMLNVAAAQIILPILPKFNNLEVNMMIPTLNANILNRTYEDILKNSLQWNIVSNLLYKPTCKSTDKVCKMLISGSLNENVASALIQFSNLNFILYTNNNNMTNISARNALLCQLWITFQTYLRPILKQLQLKGLEVMNSKLSSTQSQLTILYSNIMIPFMIIFVMIGYWITYKLHVESHEIKKQILMCDKIDDLMDKFKFRKQFIKLE